MRNVNIHAVQKVIACLRGGDTYFSDISRQTGINKGQLIRYLDRFMEPVVESKEFKSNDKVILKFWRLKDEYKDANENDILKRCIGIYAIRRSIRA